MHPAYITSRLGGWAPRRLAVGGGGGEQRDEIPTLCINHALKSAESINNVGLRVICALWHDGCGLPAQAFKGLC